MGEAARRKQALENDPQAKAGPGDPGPWWHGTNAQFTRWQVPPPPKAESTVFDQPHKSLFFSTEKDFAQGAGSRLCRVLVAPHASVLVPGLPSPGSRKLRQALLVHPAAKHCAWLQNEQTWVASWHSGNALRFGADPRVIHALLSPAIERFRALAPQLPAQALQWAAMQNLTRSWIELIAQHALELGYDAIQGRELDSRSGPGVSRTWMAVMRADAVTSPEWQ